MLENRAACNRDFFQLLTSHGNRMHTVARVCLSKGARTDKRESLHYQTCLQHSNYNITVLFERFHILISMLYITSCVLVELWNTATIVIANNANNSDGS